MYFYDELDSWELYDLDNDKNELNNIYGTPGTEALTDSLKQMLKELQVKYGEEEYIAQ